MAMTIGPSAMCTGHALLSEAPHIVYSGNLQGRDPREAGAKGAVLVTVEDGEVRFASSIARWTRCAGRRSRWMWRRRPTGTR